MRNISFMPKRDVFQTNDAVRANQPRHSAKTLRKNRVTLVRHGARTLLALLEFFLRFANFRALPMSNLQREFFQRRSDHCQRAKILSVRITLNDLRRDGSRAQAELRANLLFDRRIEMSESADRTAN